MQHHICVSLGFNSYILFSMIIIIIIIIIVIFFLLNETSHPAFLLFKIMRLFSLFLSESVEGGRGSSEVQRLKGVGLQIGWS